MCVPFTRNNIVQPLMFYAVFILQTILDNEEKVLEYELNALAPINNEYDNLQNKPAKNMHSQKSKIKKCSKQFCTLYTFSSKFAPKQEGRHVTRSSS